MTALPLVQPRRRTGGAGASGFLATLAGFDDRHRAAVEELSEVAEARRVRRGEVLWREGDVSDCVVVVRSGVVLQRRAIASHAVALDVCGRGAFLGLAGARRDHEAVMHEDGTLFVIRRADFEAWVVEHPAVAIAVIEVASGAARRMAGRLALVSMHGARARLAMLFLDLADRFGVRDSRGVIVDVRLTHREMASLIGATRETVSVAIVELRNAGHIATEARRVIVVDERALREIAGV
jgi:CRP-like cAMP-binding protein